MLQVEYLGPGGSFRVPNATGGWDVYLVGVPAAMDEAVFEQMAATGEHSFVVHPAEAKASEAPPVQKAVNASPKTESSAPTPEGSTPAAA